MAGRIGHLPRILIWVLCTLGRSPVHASAGQRPFLLWNNQDVAQIQKKIQTQSWAKAEYNRLIHQPERHEKQFSRLLQWALTDDPELAAQAKKELFRMVRSPFPQGAAQYINIIRFDMLHEQLTSDERKEVETCFRNYIDHIVFKRSLFNPRIFNNEANYARYDAKVYTRSNWLPNITWPWKTSANLMALALQDEALIRKTWAAYGSWKWYFDEYLADSGFYCEEFGKMGATPGAMLIFCRGLERLGLNELGFAYTGKDGATMRGHLESLIHLGYPRLDIDSSRPQYPMITMGDLRQSGSSQSYNLASEAFQHSIVMGYTPDGFGGNDTWKAHGAWGGTVRGNHKQWDGYSGFTPKMQIPLWFEFAQSRWPQSGFEYFLARMRAPDQDKYYPLLFFGLDPVDPAKVKAPPAPSGLWPQRGFVLLRADQSPNYWESPAPAVAMRLASNYAHNVNDSFALLGFYAFNRPIYINRQSYPGYAREWSRSVESHCGVKVDNLEPKFTDETTTRHEFTPSVKFIAARSTKVYPGVNLTRSLMLTREYLLDVTRLTASKSHRYYWLIHTLGQTDAASAKWQKAKLPNDLKALENVRIIPAGDNPWQLTTLQTCALDDPAQAKLPPAWYDRKIGVRIQMLGAKDSHAYVARTPWITKRFRDDKGKQIYKQVPSEVGGVTVIAARQAPVVTFAVLHTPFENGQPLNLKFRPIQQTNQGIALAVTGPKGSRINDRLMLQFDENNNQPITLTDGKESYTFTGFAYQRIGVN